MFTVYFYCLISSRRIDNKLKKHEHFFNVYILSRVFWNYKAKNCFIKLIVTFENRRQRHYHKQAIENFAIFVYTLKAYNTI